MRKRMMTHADFEFDESPSTRRIKRKHAEQGQGAMTDWNVSEGIRQLPPEGLHSVTRITTHTVKYVTVAFIHYHEYLQNMSAEDRDLTIERNHRGLNSHSDFSVLTMEQLTRHYKKCCGVSLHYNKTSPSGSKLEYTSKTRRYMCRKYMNLVICSQCGVRPMAGSPLERFFIILLREMLEIILPYEILTWQYYEDYYNENLKNFKLKNYRTHCSKYLFTFCFLLGYKHQSRYQWVICNNSDFYFDLAFRLQCSVRGLFGSDTVESNNERVKCF